MTFNVVNRRVIYTNALDSGGGGLPSFSATARIADQNFGFVTTANFTIATDTGCVILCFYGFLSGTITGTIDDGSGAKALTLDAQTGDHANHVDCVIMHRFGCTANAASNIVLNTSGGLFNSIGLCSGVGTGITTVGTPATQDEITANPLNCGPIIIPATGFGVFCYADIDPSTPATPAGGGLVMDFTNNGTTSDGGMAHTLSTGSVTGSINTSGTNVYSAAFVPFGP